MSGKGSRRQRREYNRVQGKGSAPMSRGERGEARRVVESRGRSRLSASEKAEKEAALRRARAAARGGRGRRSR